MLFVLYIKDQFHDYIMGGLKNNSKIRTIQIEYQNISFLIRIVRKILNICNLSQLFPSFFFKKNFLEKLLIVGKEDNLFIQGVADVKVLKILTRIVPKEIEKHLWLWNPLIKEYKNKDTRRITNVIKKLKSFQYIIETFDKEDAKNYDINLRSQFYRYPSNVKTKTVEVFDFYFLGYLKDRKDEILKIKNQLCSLGYKVIFILIKSKKEEITYINNINNIAKSKCIVDILQKEQSGMSIRPLEAAFFNKKLITNNISIIDDDIYHSENVFVLGVDNISSLPQFMQTDSIKLPKRLLDKYDINNWMQFYL